MFWLLHVRMFPHLLPHISSRLLWEIKNTNFITARVMIMGHQPTLAEVDQCSQCFQSDFGVVHPNQKPSESKTTLCAHVHALVIFHL